MMNEKRASLLLDTVLDRSFQLKPRKNLLLDSHGYIVATYRDSGVVVILNVLLGDKFIIQHPLVLSHIGIAFPFIYSVHTETDSSGWPKSEEIQIINILDKFHTSNSLPEGFLVHTILPTVVSTFIINRNHEFYKIEHDLKGVKKLEIDFTIPIPVATMCVGKGDLILIANQYEASLINVLSLELLLKVTLPPSCIHSFLSFFLSDDIVIGVTVSSVYLWHFNRNATNQKLSPQIILTESAPSAVAVYQRKIYVGFQNASVIAYEPSGEEMLIKKGRLSDGKARTWGFSKEDIVERVKAISVDGSGIYVAYEHGEILKFKLKNDNVVSQSILRASMGTTRSMALLKPVGELCVIIESSGKDLLGDKNTSVLFYKTGLISSRPRKQSKLLKKPVVEDLFGVQEIKTFFSSISNEYESREEFMRVATLISKLLNMPACLICFSGEDFSKWENSKIGLFCFHTLIEESAEFLIVNDTTADSRFKNNHLVTEFPFIKFFLGVPLLSRTHKIGTICLFDIKQRSISAYEIEILSEFAVNLVDLYDLKNNQKLHSSLEHDSSLFQQPIREIDSTLKVLRQKYQTTPDPLWDQIFLNLDIMKLWLEESMNNEKQEKELWNLEEIIKKIELLLSPLKQSMDVSIKMDDHCLRSILTDAAFLIRSLCNLLYTTFSTFQPSSIELVFQMLPKTPLQSSSTSQSPTSSPPPSPHQSLSLSSSPLSNHYQLPILASSLQTTSPASCPGSRIPSSPKKEEMTSRSPRAFIHSHSSTSSSFPTKQPHSPLFPTRVHHTTSHPSPSLLPITSPVVSPVVSKSSPTLISPGPGSPPPSPLFIQEVFPPTPRILHLELKMKTKTDMDLESEIHLLETFEKIIKEVESVGGKFGFEESTEEKTIWIEYIVYHPSEIRIGKKDTKTGKKWKKSTERRKSTVNASGDRPKAPERKSAHLPRRKKISLEGVRMNLS